MSNYPAGVLNALERLRGIPAGKALRVAVFIWTTYAVVISAIVAIQPDRRTVTPEYREAALEWWSGKDIYEVRMHGYLYLPHCAVIYTPYALLPPRLGEPLWRLTGLGLFAWGIWRLSGLFGGTRKGWWFLISTVAMVPASFSAARNGQTNLAMAALLSLAAFDLGRHAWNRASLSLLLSLALKPLGLVPCLLAGGSYLSTMTWRLVLGFLILGGIVFLHFDPGFVARQYGLFVETMMIAGNPHQKLFCDLHGMLRHFGTPLPDLVMTAVRALAALGTLVVARIALRRYEAARGAFVCMLLAAWYLLLFNPRTETNSYVLIAPFVGLLVASAAQNPKAPLRFLALAGFALILSCENWGPLHKLTNLWLKAAASLVFGGFLIRDVLAGRDPLGLSAPAAQTETPR